ncbi:MAG: hypothetical protein ACK5KR_09145 [Breznakia sp.]
MKKIGYIFIMTLSVIILIDEFNGFFTKEGDVSYLIVFVFVVSLVTDAISLYKICKKESDRIVVMI